MKQKTIINFKSLLCSACSCSSFFYILFVVNFVKAMRGGNVQIFAGPIGTITLERPKVGKEFHIFPSLLFSGALCTSLVLQCKIYRTYRILNGALCIVTGSLRLSPTDNLPILAAIKSVGLHHLGAALLLDTHKISDPEHLLHDHLISTLDARQERLKFRRHLCLPHENCQIMHLN